MQTEPASLRVSPSPPPSAASLDDLRYEAVRTRDARAEGAFFYSVATTGVYCRPTCPARLALRENVAFHASPEAAERAGYRACRRCKPRELPQRERHARVVEAARRQLESADAPVGLAALAAGAGLSPHYLHRLFKKHVGMTPGEYAATCRLRRASTELREGRPVTAAIYEAGYSSSSRFYEGGGASLGMAPSDLRRGAAGIEMRAVVTDCSLGKVLVAATSRGVCAIAFGDSPEALLSELRDRFPRALVSAADDALEELAARVVALIDTARVATTIPLDLMGTAFQQRVWRELRQIPRGETFTYTDIAKRIGAPRAVRAVGSACGKNPVAVVVPCHRVLRGDGTLGGYRWGLERKRQLLENERAPLIPSRPCEARAAEGESGRLASEASEGDEV
ncbi:MAG TPA: bifunctional DNA-binding transcriptional regulator/O6-methylguanine-DNA methyltransferase Ada [Labilithrix sp.]|nr:bifunctional DNA-binding transcriptional regulator/O6-methylguanine-DNA methyltransferase Ada [Labilithrix sp.]